MDKEQTYNKLADVVWPGLPDDVDPEQFEEALASHEQAVKVEVMHEIATQFGSQCVVDEVATTWSKRALTDNTDDVYWAIENALTDLCDQIHDYADNLGGTP